MANIVLCRLLLLLLFTHVLVHYVAEGLRTQTELSLQQRAYLSSPTHLQGIGEERINRNSRRLMIGSTKPICTYNECRGCKYRCRAEQVPVEGNDPINSAYHYRCVCHR